MKVRQMQSTKSYNLVNNQYIIEDKNKTYFQSYNMIIAVKDNKTGKIKLDKKYWNYSRTTIRYRNIFLGETTKETKEKIKKGIYKLVDLNTK